MNIGPGEQAGDNMFGFAVYVDSCPGRYDIELRATAKASFSTKPPPALPLRSPRQKRGRGAAQLYVKPFVTGLVNS